MFHDECQICGDDYLELDLFIQPNNCGNPQCYTAICRNCIKIIHDRFKG